MKTKMFGRIVALLASASLCVCMMLGVSAAETNVYASTDYANKQDQFEALMAEQANNSTITFPAPENYVEGETMRVKFIVNGKLIGEQYSDKTFVMPFCGVDLEIDGSFLKDVGGERIEIQIEKKIPILKQYKCPKCETTEKLDKEGNPTGNYYTAFEGDLSKYSTVDGSATQYQCPRCESIFELSEAGDPDLNEVVTGGLTVIETKKHPVVGDYVYELNVYSDNKAIKDYGTDDSGIKATVKVSPEAINAAKAENGKVEFNVYAYMSQQESYDNMGAVIDEAAGTASFRVLDRGWFYIAGDDPSNTEINQDQLIKKIIPFVIIGAVLVIAVVVVLVVVLNKGKKAKAE